jgi:hypothetical protein
MKKLELLSAIGWCIAGLLALRMVLGAPPAAAVPAPLPAVRPVIEEIRTSCQLPAGTVVFVVRDSEAP